MTENKKPLSSDDKNLEELVASKTSIKKAMLELQDVAEELLNISPKKLSQLPLSEIVLREIELGKKLPSSNSRRRQIQRVAKILRSENLDEISQALSEKQSDDRKQHLSINSTQQWSDKLIDNGKTALSEFMENYPSVNPQLLGQLIRNAKKEKNTDKGTSKKHQQRLFNEVQTILIKQ